MIRVRNLRKNQTWADLPPARRHFYFYLLLILVMLAVASLHAATPPLMKILPGQDLPVPVASPTVATVPVSP